MFSKTRRSLALLLALSMLLSMMSMGVSAADAGDPSPVDTTVPADSTWEDPGYPHLTVGQTQFVYISESNEYTGYFQFIPEENGIYSFTSQNDDFDTFATLLDANGSLLEEDDDDGENVNFMIKRYLTAGTPYVLKVTFLNNETADLRVFTTHTPLSELPLNERMTVELDGENTSWAYFTFTAPENGYYSFTSHSDTDTYGYLYDDHFNELAYNDDGGDGNNFMLGRYMAAGTSWIFAARFLDEATVGSFEVSVTRSPITAVSIEPITILPDTYCYVSGAYDSSNALFYYSTYNWWELINGTVTFESGDSVSFTGTSFEFDGGYYNVDYSNSQSSEALWLPDSTHTETVSVAGISTDVSVTILPSPAESVTLYDLDMPEHWLGEQRTIWDDELGQDVPYYYNYYWYNYVDGVITLKDGTALSIVDGRYEYNGEIYQIKDFSNQEADGGWTLGNTYTPGYSVMGISDNVNVSIVQTIVSDIQLQPITLMLNQNGSLVTDEETSEEYFHYSWYDYITGTVTLTDGTQLEMNSCGVNYNNDYIEAIRQDPQSAANQWVGGQTYNPTFNLLGYEAEVSVTIEDSPIAQIIVNDLSFIEGTNGSLESSWNEDTNANEDFYLYAWHDRLTGTVILTDGRQYPIEGSGFNLDGEWYGFESNDGQRESHWYAGSTYTPTITVLGKDATVNVTITQSPVASVSVDPLNMVAESMGSWSERYNPDADSYEQFFEYHFWNNLTGTVYFKDGSSTPFSGSSFHYNGQDYSFNYRNSQNEAPWSAGNSYTVGWYAMNVAGYANISIVESPVTSITIDPITITENTHGQHSERWDEESQAMVPYFRYDWESQVQGTVIFTDGTSTTFSGMSFEYNGTYYSINYTDPQEASPWQVKSTYSIAVEALGFSTNVNVTIDPRPDPDTFIKLREEISYSFTTSENMPQVNVTFTPQRSEEYIFALSGDNHINFKLTDVDGQELTASSGHGFTTSYYMNAGTMYVLEITTDPYGTFNLEIMSSPISSIIVNPVTVFENSTGYWDTRWDEAAQTDISFFHYSWWGHLSGTVFFKDGGSATFNGLGVEYNGRHYSFDYDDPQNNETWTVGNTYPAAISCMGCSTGVTINVSSSPVRSIVFDPVVIEENTFGYTEDFGNGPFYWYHWYNKLSGTIYFTDGSSYSFWGNNIIYQGMDYSFNWNDPQNDNPWYVNNTYTITMTTMGYSAPVTVSIVESPLVNVVMNPISFQKEVGGHWEWNWWDEATQTSKDFYYYEWQQKLSGTAFFSDGNSLPFTGSSFEYGGQHYELSWNTDGQSQNPWMPGNTYTIQINVGNKTAIQSVTIQPLPSVDTLPVLGENIRQNVTITMDAPKAFVAFTPAQSGSYIFSSYGYNDSYGVLYDANWNKLAEDDDSGQNSNYTVYRALTAGETYILESSFLSSWQTGMIEIMAFPNPVASITALPITIYEGTCGEMVSLWNEVTQTQEEFYRYNWGYNLQGTVTLNDGTTVPFNGSSFYYNGQSHEFEIDYSQQYDTHWSAPGTYNVQFTCYGIPAATTVTIAQAPIASIELDPIAIPEHTGGYYSSDYIDGAYVNYYHYTSWRTQLTGTVYFKDGSSSPVTGGEFTYEGKYYSITTHDLQSAHTPWLAGNTYAVDVSVMGFTGQQLVSICIPVSASGYSYIVQNGKVIITDCTLTDTVLRITDTIEGLPVVGIVSLGTALEYCEELIIPDSVTMLSSNMLHEYYSPMKKLTLGAGVKELGMYDVFSLAHLESIQVSENNPNFTSIDGVVYDKAVTELVLLPLAYPTTYRIPDSVTNISIMLWHPLEYYKVKFLPGAGIDNLTVIDGVVYDDVVSTVYSISKECTGELVLPETVTSIRSHALAGSNLSSITIPKSVTQIAYGAFYGSTSLQSVELPDTLTGINMNAFRECTSLESVAIPSSCAYISSGAFYNCTGLEKVYIEDLSAWSCTNFGGAEANPLYYAGNLYVDGQLVTDLVIPETVGSMVYDSSFAGIKVNSITVPATVYSIGVSAFEGALVSQIQLPEKLQYIDTRAFAGSALTSITLPDSVMMSGYEVFEDCYQLETAVIGSGLYSISMNMFNGSGLEHITLPSNIEYVGTDAFKNCRQLRSVTFEGDYIEIADGAFLNCPLRDIDLPQSTFFTAWNTFNGAAAATVSIPDTVTELSYRTFAFNENLMSVVIPTSVESIWGNTFEGCTNLSHVLYEGTQDQWNHVEVYSAEFQNANLHLEASADDITVRYYCHQIQHYCAVCNEWEYKDLDGKHSYADGVCTLCGYNEFSAFVDGEPFKTLEEALDAADAGDTVELNNHIVTDQLILDSGAQLDLNGWNLIVSGVIVVFDGQIIDSSEGEGAIIMDENSLELTKDNVQLPLYDTTTGSYHFYSYTVTVKGVRENADGSVTYGFRFNFGGDSAYEILQKSEASGMTGIFTLNWVGGDPLSLSFSDALIRQYAALTQRYGNLAALMVTVTGLETLEPGTELTAVAGIYSNYGVSKTGDNMVYTTPNA